MAKDTQKIVEELKLCDSFKSFYNENKEYYVDKSLSELLQQLLTEKGLKKAQVIKNAEISEVYGYQIFSGVRVPEKNKLLALAVGFGLNLDEVQNLLKCAGYSQLYVKHPLDSIVIYGICNKKTVVEINELLYEYGFETLG